MSSRVAASVSMLDVPAKFQGAEWPERSSETSFLPSSTGLSGPKSGSPGGRTARLVGREAECNELDSLLEAVRRGESRSLVLCGEAGVGKTALLGYLTKRATDCRVVSVTAVQTEMELPFAALHQICAPMLGEVEVLSAPQRDALLVTFGFHEGPAPDRFLVGLAVLSLLAEVAVHRPLVCAVDDQQWLDRASVQVLAFVARRLGTESVGLIFGARTPSDELAGLPELMVRGLRDEDAHALLGSASTGPLDKGVHDRIVAECRGNPLALLELPRAVRVAELAGGFGLPASVRLSGALEKTFNHRGDALPEQSRRLLLVAAAEPLGDPVLLWRAAERLGLDAEAARPVADAGLVEFGTRVRFRHPLVRSAIYQSASAQERHEVHGALAQATDALLDPDRRAWHLAQATPGPDEDVAADLEDSAKRAQARGGFAAAAAFLERAAALTPEASKRTTRALAGAQAKIQAGALDAGLDLLSIAEAGPASELERAHADLLRAQVAYVGRRGSDAPPALLAAAKRLEPIARDLGRATYVDAMLAAVFAGRLAAPGGSVLDVALQVGATSGHAPTASDLLLDGLVANFLQGYTQSVPVLQRALRAFLHEVPANQELRGMPLALLVSTHLWDDGACVALSGRWAEFCRSVGALSDLPIALNIRAVLLLFAGDVAGAASLVEELRVTADATGVDFQPVGAMGVAAFRGHGAESPALFEASISEALLRGEGSRLEAATWASAVLNNGLGRYEAALAGAQQACESPLELVYSYWALPELVEAAVRSGQRAAAVEAHRRLAEMALATASCWALGLEARSRALLADGAEAEASYQESVEQLSRSQMRSELARARLLYGEWLRRQGRRGDARDQLRTALGMFEAMGMEGFSERARRELRATGERARKRNVSTRSDLTSQEAQVAKLARDGLSNPEIGARLYISARTVEYHLGKVFMKLGITSRAQLDRVFG